MENHLPGDLPTIIARLRVLAETHPHNAVPVTKSELKALLDAVPANGASIVTIQEADAKLIDLHFLPRNPNKLLKNTRVKEAARAFKNAINEAK